MGAHACLQSHTQEGEARELHECGDSLVYNSTLSPKKRGKEMGDLKIHTPEKLADNINRKPKYT